MSSQVKLCLKSFTSFPQNLIHSCRCVCKLWSSLISQPRFPAQYLLRTKPTPPPNPTFYFFMYDDGAPIFKTYPLRHSIYDDRRKSWSQDTPALSLSFLPQPEATIRLRTSSNGLALCTIIHDCERIYYVCNPITKQCLTLPPPPTCTHFALVGLVCSNHHFKVVRLVSPASSDTSAPTFRIYTSSFSAETFDSRTNLWKVSPLITIPRSVLLRKPTNAIEHKGLMCRESYEKNSISASIMAFDLNLESCSLIQVLGNMSGICVTGVSGSHLYHVHLENNWPANTTRRTWIFVWWGPYILKV